MARRNPYTETGIARLPCAHCGKKSAFQWNASICANGNKTDYRPLCRDCDFYLNEFVLEFFNFANAKELIERYRKKTG